MYTLSWRARGERERDAGPIKKIITRFRGTSSSPNFDAPRSRKQTGATSCDFFFSLFIFFFLDANTQRPCKRHYSNIADIPRRPKIIPISFRFLKDETFTSSVFQKLLYIRICSTPARGVFPFIPNEISLPSPHDVRARPVLVFRRQSIE